MGTCLVTKLKESVPDESILALGELKIHFKQPTQAIGGADDVNFFYCLQCNAPMKIVGDGYFTNSTGTSNLGKTHDGRDNQPVYFSHGEYDIIVENKYDITGLSVRAGSPYLAYPFEINIEDFEFSSNLDYLDTWLGINIHGSVNKLPKNVRQVILRCGSNPKKRPSGDLSAFEGNTNLQNLDLEGCNIKGNLSSLSGTNLTGIAAYGADFEGSVNSLAGLPLTYVSFGASPKITGNLSAFSGKSMTSIWLVDTQVTGSLSALASSANTLTNLNISGTQIFGDTSDLAGFTQLTSFGHFNCPNITGTWPLA